ncbi:MAG: tRNA epoxyqueuosine(34) reductase QueG [Anaerolineae bacterium]
MSLTSDILAYALSLGFDRAAVLPVRPPRYAAQFAAWLAAGYHGEMAYLATRAAERLDPLRFAPGAASMIVVVTNYDPGQLIGPGPDRVSSGPAVGPSQGRIAHYARWSDYHDVIKPQLYALDAFIRARTGRQTHGKAFVDSAPVLERDFAEQAGLGFIGRNTCLITPGLGSWTVLAGLMVPEELTPAPSPTRRGEERRCGRCTRCLDACPTRAFVAPHVLDAQRCISYLTIELRSPIPRELRPLMGNWVFGCDVCQEVCPYNRRRRFDCGPAVETAATPAKSISAGLDLVGAGQLLNGSRDFRLPDNPALSTLLALDETGFRARFRGTPVLRAKRRGLVRNACVAAGNSGDSGLVPLLAALLSDPEPLVRGHAAWALGRIGGPEAMHALAHAGAREPDPWVQEEIAAAAV